MAIKYVYHYNHLVMNRTNIFCTHLLLMVMLTTFLSPSMSTGMIISHDQLSHSTFQVESKDARQHHSHGHPHVQSDQALEEHQEAHSLIGHLLAHMPADLLASSSLDVIKPSQTTPLFFHAPVVPRYLEPPLPPPKVTLA
jgi:hypothetical protein